jgi:hypothetical protein
MGDPKPRILTFPDSDTCRYTVAVRDLQNSALELTFIAPH